MSSVLKFKDNETGAWKEIQTIKGPTGEAGKDGKDGADYVLTSEDKAEIAALSGGGCKVLSFIGQEPTDETREWLNNYFKQYKDTGAPPDQGLIITSTYWSGTYVVLNCITLYSTQLNAVSAQPAEYAVEGSLQCYGWNGEQFNAIYANMWQYDPEDANTSSSDWTWNGDNWGQESVYLPDNCKEVKLSYVSQYNGSYTMTVHLTPSNGNHFHEEMDSYYSAVYPNYSDDQPRVHNFYYGWGNYLGVNIDGYTFLGYHYK